MSGSTNTINEGGVARGRQDRRDPAWRKKNPSRWQPGIEKKGVKAVKRPGRGHVDTKPQLNVDTTTESSTIPAFGEFLWEVNLDRNKVDTLIRLGLGELKELRYYQKAMHDPRRAVRDVNYRDRVAIVLERLLGRIFKDQVMYTRLRNELQKDHRVPAKKLRTEELDREAVRTAFMTGIPLWEVVQAIEDGHGTAVDEKWADAGYHVFKSSGEHVSGPHGFTDALRGARKAGVPGHHVYKDRDGQLTHIFGRGEHVKNPVIREDDDSKHFPASGHEDFLGQRGFRTTGRVRILDGYVHHGFVLNPSHSGQSARQIRAYFKQSGYKSLGTEGVSHHMQHPTGDRVIVHGSPAYSVFHFKKIGQSLGEAKESSEVVAVHGNGREATEHARKLNASRKNREVYGRRTTKDGRYEVIRVKT